MFPLLALVVALTPHLGLGSNEPGNVTPPGGKATLIDVSNHQGSIDWQGVADSGVSGVYHKLSEGEDWRDPFWTSARKSALREAGLRWGFYHFVRPERRPAAREARWFVSQARQAGGWGQLLPALDVEVTELGPRRTGQYLADLVRAMRRQGVGKMLLYASPGWWRSRVALVPSLRRQLRYLRPWIAHWNVQRPDALQGMRGWVLHQYTARGRVGGIKGPVDMNRTDRMRSLLRKR